MGLYERDERISTTNQIHGDLAECSSSTTDRTIEEGIVALQLDLVIEIRKQMENVLVLES